MKGPTVFLISMLVLGLPLAYFFGEEETSSLIGGIALGAASVGSLIAAFGGSKTPGPLRACLGLFAIGLAYAAYCVF